MQFRFTIAKVAGLVIAVAVAILGTWSTASAAFFISEVHVFNEEENTVRVVVQTSDNTQATVTLLDQLATEFKPSQTSQKFLFSHEFRFKNLPDTRYIVQVEAKDQGGEYHKYPQEISVSTMADVGEVTGGTGSDGIGPCGGTNSDGSQQPTCTNSGSSTNAAPDPAGNTPLCPPDCSSPGIAEGNGGGNQWPNADPGANKGQLKIQNAKTTVVDQSIVTLTYETTVPAGSTAYARNPKLATVVTAMPIRPNQTTHEVTFCGLEANGTYEFAITASTTSDRAVYFYPEPVTLSGATAKEGSFNCSNAGNAGPAGGFNNQPSSVGIGQNDDSSPLAGLLYKDGKPIMLQLGARSFALSSLLWWILLVLVSLSTLLEIFFFIKQRRLWGVVYDARSKQPVDIAIIRLFRQADHKMIETRVTSKSGRYSFLADPGEYYLEVIKEGYHFPSRIITTSADNEYISVYRGEVIKLGVGQSLIAPDVPIDGESTAIVRINFYRRFIFPLLETIRFPLLVITLVFLIVYGFIILQPTPLFFFLLSAVVMLFLIEFIFIRRGHK